MKRASICGGQKQRISVARAAYSGKDIIILDDPMSALDPEVAHRLFSECIKQVLAGKTVILATSSLELLSECDYVVVLENSSRGDGVGRIREQGTYHELQHAGLDFADRSRNLASGKMMFRMKIRKEASAEDENEKTIRSCAGSIASNDSSKSAARKSPHEEGRE